MDKVPLCTKVAQYVKTSALTPQGEFLRWYHRLGHLSYKKMILLCTLCILPRRLFKVKPPMCVGCKAGAMIRKPTKVKGQKFKGLWKQTTKPGEYTSVDQTISRTPGFIGVIRGFLCKQRYTCATIFVDHFSDHTYTHIQRSTSLQDTLAAFRAYENCCDRHGVKVRHYHVDNSRFADQGFLDSLAQDQTINFCGA